MMHTIDLQQAAAEQNAGTNCLSTGEGTGNGRYWYNGDGLRVQERSYDPSRKDVFNVWDAGSPLPVILEQTVVIGASSSCFMYVYGLDLIGRFACDGTGDTYYLTDGLGSTAGIADGNGNQTATYAYDACGALRSTPPLHSNPFRFTGEQQDRAVQRGLYFLRARHYDPALGRFLQKDPVPFVNRYAYVRNNPCSNTDATGMASESVFRQTRCSFRIFTEGIGRHPGIRYVNNRWGKGHDNPVVVAWDVTFTEYRSGDIRFSTSLWSDGRLGWTSSGPVATEHGRHIVITEQFYRERRPLKGSTLDASLIVTFREDGSGMAWGFAGILGGHGIPGNLIKVYRDVWCDPPSRLNIGGFGSG